MAFLLTLSPLLCVWLSLTLSLENPIFEKLTPEVYQLAFMLLKTKKVLNLASNFRNLVYIDLVLVSARAVGMAMGQFIASGGPNAHNIHFEI